MTASTAHVAGAQLRQIDLLLSVGGLLLMAGIHFGSLAFASHPADCLIRNSVRLALVWYAAALLLMPGLHREDWAARTARGRAARWCWSLGCAAYLLHVGAAFQYVHHWSPANAFEHTRQISGVGEGIYVNYLFTALWMADSLWWGLAPAKYAERPRWMDAVLHSFMLFIVFNGAVVFAAGATRWVSAAALALCGALATRRWLLQSRRSGASTPRPA